MARWHVNPSTGEAGKCTAEYACPFGGSLGGHTSTKGSAAALYEDYRTHLHNPSGVSRFYFVSDEEHEAFTSGDCGRLASVLHRATGYPVVAVGIKDTASGSVAWLHMVVKASDGRFLDVTSIQPEEELRQAWSHHFSLEPSQEITLEVIPEAAIEDYLEKAPDETTYPSVNPVATASKLLKALHDKH